MGEGHVVLGVPVSLPVGVVVHLLHEWLILVVGEEIHGGGKDLVSLSHLFLAVRV